MNEQTQINNQIELSLVIPAFKEELHIGSTLETVFNFLCNEQILGSTEVIVVAADGDDDTSRIAIEHSVNFPNFALIEPGRKLGKGRDVRVGMLQASGSYVLFMDADLATPIKHIPDALNILKNGSDLVIGKRNLHKIHHGYRSIISVFANKATRAIVLPGFADTQCGFKGFKSNVAKDLFSVQEIDGWGFDIEILAIAADRRYKISEIEIPDWHDPKLDEGLVGESSIKAVSNTFMELFKIRKNIKQKHYKETSENTILPVQ